MHKGTKTAIYNKVVFETALPEDSRVASLIYLYSDQNFPSFQGLTALMVIVGQGIFRDLAYFLIIADVTKAK